MTTYIVTMPQKSSALHDAAREWASLGFAIFPINPLAKTPATANGFKDATTDLGQIDAWWAEDPTYNIGWSPASSGMAVLDTDPPLGEETLETIVRSEGEGSWPQTYTVLTPRGGHHFYFVGDVKSTVGTATSGLGPKLDTRGRGGYVLLPPSITDKGTYSVIDDREMADLPSWINARLANKEAHHVAGTETLDLPANLGRAKSVLASAIERNDIAIEGAGGDDRTLRQIFELRDLGVSEETALKLLSEENGWNAHCLPPWDLDELATKVRNAYTYAQNEAGAYAVAPASEAFADLIAAQPRPKFPRFHAFSELEQDDWPEPKWLLPQVLPEESTVMLFGPSRSYKSFLAMDMALGFAYGKETFGFTPQEPVETLYIAGEAPRGLSRQRRPAWKLARGADGSGLFYLIKDMPTLLNGGIDALAEQLKTEGRAPKLIVIDTLAKAISGMNENDARDAGMFIAGMERLRDEHKATVIIVHHTGKDVERGARGSSAFFNGFDAALEVSANNKTHTVRIDVRKMKDADEREEPFLFEGKQVGPGLVFFPMESDAYNSLNQKDDPFSPSKVGAALRLLRAFSMENAVTSPVLATALFPPVQGENQEERALMLGKAARRLVKLSADRLEAYKSGSGHDLRWYLPQE